MQEEKKNTPVELNELSETWRALLGDKPLDEERLAALKDAVPSLDSDPWSALLHAQGVEMVDLQQVHLNISNQDMEQVLQLMQEQLPTHDPE